MPESTLPDEKAEIRVRDLRKRIGAQQILDGIDLAVQEGKTLVLLGRSGAGKSVLLKHVLGLWQPDGGSVSVCGEEIVGQPERELRRIRAKMGMLFQNAALFDSMSLFDNVAFPLRERERRLPAAEVSERVQHSLALVGLDKHAHKLPAALSGGMRKRAGLARAIITHPRCILYDEPTSGLDPVASDSINTLIRRLQSDLGVTSIVVTHDMKSAFSIGDTLAFLNEGRIYFQGSAEQWRTSQDPLIQDFVEGRSRETMEVV